ncbi:MAG: hypothetical protein Q4D04_09975 [Clostridia bacterium]|nr:hypothetical protein [Clostridia bacterium]
MGCDFLSNPFCAGLPDELRAMLCPVCHIKRYAQGQYCSQEYWKNTFALLLDGLMIMGDVDPATGRILTNGIASRGTLISDGGLITGALAQAIEDRSVLCLLDCSVATFSSVEIGRIFKSNMEFAVHVFENCMQNCSVEKSDMMREVGSKDAYAGVRYVIRYCRRHNIPQLTHAQIAMICNRSRTTVTEIMHKLIRAEPELFC